MPMLAQIQSSPLAPDTALLVGQTLARASGRTAPPRTLQQGHAVFAFEEAREVSFVYESDGRSGVPAGFAAVMGYVRIDGIEPTGPALGAALLSRWKERGVGFLEELEGSFSLILTDAAGERVLIAADCLASRQVWYGQADGRFVLGDDSRAVRELLRLPPRLDPAYLWSFFHHSSTIGSRSAFEGIQALEAGEVLVFERGVLNWRGRHSTPKFQPRHNNARSAAEELLSTLRATVDGACAGTKAPCVFLSGGLDSRLIAGVCREGVNALTLCDSPNRETAIAARVAETCGLRHRLLVRPEGWYPSLLRDASICGQGLWNWNEGHYIPLSDPSSRFDYDVAILGFGSNTYFKGLHLVWPRLWEAPPANVPLQDYMLDLIMNCPVHVHDTEAVFRPEMVTEMKEAYRAAAQSLLATLMPFSEQVPDLWELYWGHSLVRVMEALNLVCLRDIVSERNAFSSRRIHRLYLGLPPRLRFGGPVVRQALRQLGRGLATIPDANTWLPAGFPQWLHKLSGRARQHVARVRALYLNLTGSKNFRSRGSWPHITRLWAASDVMHKTMDDLVADDAAFPETVFDRRKIRSVWQECCQGQLKHMGVINSLATFGLFHRDAVEARPAIPQSALQ